MLMMIYRLVEMYGDGIILIDSEKISENNFNLYKNHHYKFIGKQSFNKKILDKLDVQKTLETHGIIDLTYFE